MRRVPPSAALSVLTLNNNLSLKTWRNRIIEQLLVRYSHLSRTTSEMCVSPLRVPGLKVRLLIPGSCWLCLLLLQMASRYTLLIFLISAAFFYSTNGRPNIQGTVQAQPDDLPPQQYNEWKSAWKNLKAAFRNVGDWFVRQYRTVQSWFAQSRQELERKVQDMANFLGEVKQNINTLVAGAGTQLQAGLQNVANYYEDVVQFQQRMRADVSATFEQLEDEWQRKVQNMYNGGLDKVVNAAQAAKMGEKLRARDSEPNAAGNSTRG